MTRLKSLERNGIKRFVEKWRELSNRDEGYAEAFFVGGWTFASDEEAAEILAMLDKDDLVIIMEYPIFM